MRTEVIHEKLGKWWQKDAMFSPAQGMHSLLHLPEDADAADAAEGKQQTAFYDEIIKMAETHENIKVKFLFDTRVEKIKKSSDGKGGEQRARRKMID